MRDPHTTEQLHGTPELAGMAATRSRFSWAGCCLVDLSAQGSLGLEDMQSFDCHSLHRLVSRFCSTGFYSPLDQTVKTDKTERKTMIRINRTTTQLKT